MARRGSGCLPFFLILIIISLIYVPGVPLSKAQVGVFEVIFDDNLAFYRDELVYRAGQTFEIAVLHDVGSTVTMTVADPNQTYGITRLTWKTRVTQINDVMLTIFKQQIPLDACNGEYKFKFEKKNSDGTKETKEKTAELCFDIKSPEKDPDTGKKWTDGEDEEYRRGKKSPFVKDELIECTAKAEEPSTLCDTIRSKKIMEELDKILKDLVKCEKNHTEAANKIRRWISGKAHWKGEDQYTDAKKFLKKIEQTGCKTTVPAQCSDFAELLVAFLRKAGIPARFVVGDYTDGKPWKYHMWVEFWCGEKWSVIDSTTPGPATDATDRKTYWKCKCLRRVWYWNGTHFIDITDKYKDAHKSESHSVLIIPSTDKPEYLIGENVTINVEFRNVELIDKMITYNIVVGRSADIDAEMFYVLNVTDVLSIPAGTSKKFLYTMPKEEYVSNGDYVVAVSTNETLTNSTWFHIKGGVALSLLIPPRVNESQVFDFSLNITNILPIPVNDLNVSLSFPYFSSLPDTSFSIAALLPGEIWHSDFAISINESSKWRVWTFTTSIESGFVYESAPIEVLSPPFLEVRNDFSPQECIDIGETFAISSQINNLGDHPVYNLAVTLQSYGGFSTTEPLTKSIGSLLGGEAKAVSWTVVATTPGNFLYTISAVDYTSQFKDTNYALVSIHPPIGGIAIPIDNSVEKPNLFVPYIGLTSSIVVATVAIAVTIKRVKHRKEK